jgi:hypothetical protein
MVGEPGGAGRWPVRVVVYAGALGGVVLLLAAALVPDAPRWWWVLGGVVLVLLGPLAVLGLHFRLRHRTPAARQEAIDRLGARAAVTQALVDRSDLAHRATKGKAQVLRDGVEATAVVTFLADGGRANEFRQLVYLELEVTVAGQPPYAVRTGEHLNAASSGSVAPGRTLHVRVDPADPQRVAVDWERSLRR